MSEDREKLAAQVEDFRAMIAGKDAGYSLTNGDILSYLEELLARRADDSSGASTEVDEAKLASLLRDHRRNRAVGRHYECLCGTRLRSNSHHAQSEHQARAVVEYLRGER